MDCHNYYDLSITVCSISHWKSIYINVWRGISSGLDGKVLPSAWSSLKRLITGVSHLSQKPVMSSPIYIFVLDSMSYKIQDFTLNIKPWYSSHWKMLTNKGGGEIVLSPCSRESNPEETQEIDSLTGKYWYYQSKITLFSKKIKINKYDNFIPPMEKNAFWGKKLNPAIKSPPWRCIL